MLPGALGQTMEGVLGVTSSEPLEQGRKVRAGAGRCLQVSQGPACGGGRDASVLLQGTGLVP